MNAARPNLHLFTIRLWPAPGPGAGAGWRGRVTHVLSGETRRFRAWPALLAFLAAEPMSQAAPARRADHQERPNRAPPGSRMLHS